MSAEHKRPLYAFVLVTALSVLLVGHALRSDALVGILSGIPVEHRIMAADPIRTPTEMPPEGVVERDGAKAPSTTARTSTDAVNVDAPAPSVDTPAKKKRSDKPGVRKNKSTDKRADRKSRRDSRYRHGPGHRDHESAPGKRGGHDHRSRSRRSDQSDESRSHRSRGHRSDKHRSGGPRSDEYRSRGHRSDERRSHRGGHSDRSRGHSHSDSKGKGKRSSKGRGRR